MTSNLPLPEQIPGKDGENQFLFVLNVGARRWRMITAFTLIACIGYGVVGLTRFRQPSVTQAYTDLIVKQTPWEKEILQNVGGRPLIPTTPTALIKRMSDRGLAEDVTRALVQQDIVEGWAGAGIITEEEYAAKADIVFAALNVQPVADSAMIRITAQHVNRDEAVRMAEFAARTFIERNRRFFLEEEEETHAFVVEQLEELRQRLDDAESAEWEYKKQMGFRTHDQVTRDMEAMNERLVTAETTQEEILAKVAEIEEELRRKNEVLPEALGHINDSVVNKLMGELDELVQEELSMSMIWQPEFPDLDMLREDIVEKKQAILVAINRLDRGVAAGANLWEDRQQLRQQHLQLQLELTALEIRAKTMRKLLSEMVERLPELASKSLKHQRLEREAEQLRLQFDKLLEKEFDIRTALQRVGGQVDRHTPVRTREIEQLRLKRWINFVVGGLVGFILGFVFAIVLEISDTSIKSIDDATEFLALEVIGTIPRMRFGKLRRGRRRRGTFVAVVDEEQIDACIVTQHDPKSPISEAYRTLRTNFQFATIQQRPRTVMVTSAVPGEGKTTTAVNMAVTMADSGMRVLVMDTDLRRPNVHHVLKTERGFGLADVLREEAGLDDAIRPTSIENLWIMSSGRVPPNPSELIGSERMGSVMKQLGEQFDLVLCDAPSILVVTDPVLLARTVDTVVLVVSVNNARRETILRAKKLLETARASIAGIVLNGLEASRRHYYYYYYYYDDTSVQSQRRWIQL